MYVCFCFNKTESDIKEAIKDGYDTIDALSEYLHVSQGCGVCREHVESLLSSMVCSVCGMKPDSCCN